MVSKVASLQTGASMQLLAIVFAFAVAAVIVWRRGRLGWPARLAAAAAPSAALALGTAVRRAAMGGRKSRS